MNLIIKKSVFIFFIIFCLSNLYCGNSKKKSIAIHSFDGTAGATPKGTLTLVNNKLYGYTSGGGKNGKGVIFMMDDTGKNFKVVYDFVDGADNGLGNESHHDALYYYDSALYGAALYGGIKDNGVIFRINPDGTGYKPIHIFEGGPDDGAHPHSGVIAVDSFFYGMTAEGGSGHKGTIYKMKPDGSEYSILYSFQKETGHNPHARLTLGTDGHTLFGIARTGGTDNLGVIFSYDLSDSNYKVLHNFQKDKKNGYTPEHGYLTLADNKLFGMTKYGGEKDKGVIYSINQDGSDFKIIHSFKPEDKDGKSPFGSLYYSNGFLYGTTQEGGENDKGTIFRISPNGRIYEIIHSFDVETSGEYPIDNVILNDEGTVFFCYGQQGGEHDQTGKKEYGTIVRIDEDNSIK
jgi:uncharacterized repeat protein (TIGR03803 family)